MAEPTFPNGTPETPQVRTVSAMECAENFVSSPGFRNAKADEYYNGSNWVRCYTIYGTLTPVGAYANATIGSKYCNYETGEWWTMKSLNGTLTWVLDAGVIVQAEGDTSISNIVNLAAGTLVQDSDNWDLYVKASASLSSGTAELIGTQT